MTKSLLEAARTSSAARMRVLATRMGLCARAARSPYRFTLREIWSDDPALGWVSPKIEVIGRDASLLELKLGQVRFFWPVEFDPSDLPWLYNEVFRPAHKNAHAYEYGQVEIAPGEWVIDGGAGEGFFTAYALRRGASVLAIEPVESLCRALARTFEIEILQGRVRILQACLGMRNSTAMLDQRPRVCLSRVGEHGTEPVSAYAIDTVVSEGLLPKVGFIKMDLEGAEVDALHGSVTTLATFKPRLAIAVYHELDNAKLARQVVLASRGDYVVMFRGMYGWDRCIPRPYMLLAH